MKKKMKYCSPTSHTKSFKKNCCYSKPLKSYLVIEIQKTATISKIHF